MATWKPSNWKQVGDSVHAAHRITQVNAQRLREASEWLLVVGDKQTHPAESGWLLIMPDGEQFFAPAVPSEYPEPAFVDPRPKEAPPPAPS